jgi:L-amino acid N-acyltransferase YncA
MSQITIRMATLNDAQAIYHIYEPYILNTVITFEYDKVPLNVFEERMKKVMEKFPWLVCEIDGVIAGYAYCSPHLERAAFGWDCECSVYLSDQFKRMHIGSALYAALFNIIKEQGFYNIYSLICVPHESSVALHKKLGFTEVGTYYNTAFKFGEWRHLLVMEKRIREIVGEPQPIKTINMFDNNFLENEFRKAEKLIQKSKKV